MRLSLSTFRNTANATISVAELQKYIRPAGTGNNNYLFNKLLCGVYRELQVCTEAVQRQWHLTVWRFILSSPFLKALMIQKPLPKQVTLLHTPERSPDEQSTQSVFVREWVSEKCTLTALGKKIYIVFCGMLHLQSFCRKQNLVSYWYACHNLQQNEDNQLVALP